MGVPRCWTCSSAQCAAAINKLVFLFPLPLLLFGLIAQAPAGSFAWPPLLAYIAIEIVMYAAGYGMARHVFGLPRPESLLLGMVGVFCNHVYYVLPIARYLFGDAAALPIVAIICLDAVVIFGGTLLIMDTIAAGGASLTKLGHQLAGNPIILSLIAGVLANTFGVPITGGLAVFVDFAGSAAAPASLFALGVIMALQRADADPVLPWLLTLVALVAMPALATLILGPTLNAPAAWASPLILVAAGPAGMMPFVIALRYGVPTANIVRTIFISTVLSLGTVTAAIEWGW
mgnify:CR=1 FL=1